MLKFGYVINYPNIKRKMFGYLNDIYFIERGRWFMTGNEIELINIIREQDNPIQALRVAINIIVSYLVRHESSPKPYSVVHREHA